MKWTPGNRGNIEDRRGSSGARMGGLGIGGLVVVLLLSWATGVDFLSLLSGGGGPGGAPSESVGTSGPVSESAEETKLRDMVDNVAEDAQQTWQQLLGNRYQRTSVVLFRQGVNSGCGYAPSAVGPFYCPADRKVYLDLSFYDELHRRFGAPGDFAQAYVLAHEIGHHVQTVTGLESQVRKRQASSPSDKNELSVRMELQADCFAGVWGYHANRTAGGIDLESGDVEEALGAAAAIGDDRIQRQTTGGVNPESFTHGSAEQRVSWFRRGFQSGDPEVCETFK
jgi:predicted metalloprotease